MIRKSYWGVAALMLLLALSFTTSCSSSPATAMLAAPTTVTSDAPFSQSASMNTPFPSTFSATVTTNNSPISGVVVTFTAPGAGAGGTFANGQNSTTATTDASGVATSSTFTANGTTGTYIVVASAQGTQSTSLYRVANTLVPATITATGGTPQSAAVSGPFAVPLQATVLDSSSQPVINAAVTFAAPSFTLDANNVPSTASGTFLDYGTVTSTVWTDSNGVATAPLFTANALAGGPYTVSATVVVSGTTTLSANFSLTNQ